jgi:hypothetical protein
MGLRCRLVLAAVLFLRLRQCVGHPPPPSPLITFKNNKLISGQQMWYVPIILLRRHVQGPVVICISMDHHPSNLPAVYVRSRCRETDRCLRVSQDASTIQYHGCVLCVHVEPVHQVLAGHARTRSRFRSSCRWTLSPCYGNGHPMVLDQERLGCWDCVFGQQFR